MVFTAGVAAYLVVSNDFGSVYGPLTAVVVLLLWAQLIAAAILLGIAVSAQIEAELAGVHRGAPADPEEASAARRLSARGSHTG